MKSLGEGCKVYQDSTTRVKREQKQEMLRVDGSGHMLGEQGSGEE